MSKENYKLTDSEKYESMYYQLINSINNLKFATAHTKRCLKGQVKAGQITQVIKFLERYDHELAIGNIERFICVYTDYKYHLNIWDHNDAIGYIVNDLVDIAKIYFRKNLIKFKNKYIAFNSIEDMNYKLVKLLTKE